MAGRVQGDPGSARRPSLRLTLRRSGAAAAATVVVAALFASAVLSVVDVLPSVENDVARYSKLTDEQREHAAGDRLRLRRAPFAAFRARVHAGERYAVEVPPGAKGPFITRGAVVRSYSAFFFFPAIQTRQAELVFRYRFR